MIPLLLPSEEVSFAVSPIPQLIAWDHRLMNKLNVMVKLYEKCLHKASYRFHVCFMHSNFSVSRSC